MKRAPADAIRIRRRRMRGGSRVRQGFRGCASASPPPSVQITQTGAPELMETVCEALALTPLASVTVR